MKRPNNRNPVKQPEDTPIELPGTRKRAKSVALLSALVLAVCMGPALAQEPSEKGLRTFYQQKCVGCHGVDGSAVSVEGEKLRGQDFTDTNWQRGTRDAEMVDTILNGKFFGLVMPGFKDALTEDEAHRMVTDVIRKSKKGHVIAPGVEMPGGK